MQRIELMKQRLQQAFTPTHLEVIDDSHQHIGHAGSRGGAGHYTVIISANEFNQLSRVEAHRRVYAIFDDLIPDQIHALKIKIK